MNVFYPNSGFLIEGENLSSVVEVLWGDQKIESSSFKEVSDSAIEGITPANAISAEVFVVDSEGELHSLGFKYVGLNEDSKVEIQSFSPLSGFGDQDINLIGNNFHQIDEVTISDEKVDYTVLSENSIVVKPKRNKNSGFIKVKTSSRGVVNPNVTPSDSLDPSYSFSQSNIPFAYYPEITGLSSRTNLPGSELLISGTNLDGVTGVKFGDLDYIQPDLVSVGEMKVTVPEGDVGGFISLAKDGLFILNNQLEDLSFYPSISITGLQPAEGVKSSQVLIEGVNLLESNLLVEDQSSGKVNFGGIDTFFDITDQGLLGNIPEGASLGYNEVKVYSPTESLYDSSKFFYNSGDLPTLNSSSLTTVITGDTLSLFGENFTSAEEVELSLNGQTYDVSSSYFSTKGSDTKLQLTVPSFLQVSSAYSSEHGWVDVRVKNKLGYSNPLESGFYLLGKPFISGVYDSDSKKSPNERVILSGSNFSYNDSVKIYNADGELENEIALADTGLGAFELESGSFFLPNTIDYSEFYVSIEGKAGTSNNSPLVGVSRNPVISGFDPVSGYSETVITISGVLDGITEIVADSKNVDFNYISNDAISLTYPDRSNSSKLFVYGSGGVDVSAEEFNVIRSLPTIDGISESGEIIRGALASVSGRDLDILESIIFLDKQGEEVFVSSFESKNSYSASFIVPLSVSSDFGNSIELLDTFGRRAVSELTYNVSINITDFHGEKSVKVSSPCEAVNNIATGVLSGYGFLSVENLYFSGEGNSILNEIEDYEVINDNLIYFNAVSEENISGEGDSGENDSGENDSGENDSGENDSGENVCGWIVAASAKDYASSENGSTSTAFLNDFTLSGFSPEGGDETSVIEISGNGFLDVTGVKFDQFSSSFSIIGDSNIVAEIPQDSLNEGQDVIITLLALGSEIGFDKTFELISSISSINFKVLAQDPPTSAFSSSSLFTVVETDSNGEWYVTKMTNPDGSSSIISTELIT